MKKKKLFILFLTILIFISFANPVFARQYIGDEDPTNFALGDGESPEQIIDRNKAIIPGLFPKEEQFLEELNWIKYPFEHYYFKTASSKDKGFFQNKIEDVGAVVTDLLASVFLSIEIFLSTIGNNIILVCFHDFWTDGVYDFVNNMAGMFVDGLQGNNIVGLLFIVALVILGITIASYLLKAQVMKAFTAILTSAICIGLFLGYLTIISSILPGVLNFVNNFTGAALVATHYMKEAPMNPDETAPTPPAELGPVVNNPLTGGLIEATNACWQATLAGPWAAAQFGYSNPNKLALSNKEIEQINNDNNAWFKWKGILPDVDVAKLFPGRKQEIPEPAYMDTVWLASSGSARETILDAITNPSLKESDDRRTFAAAGCGQASAMYHLGTSLLMFPAAILFFAFTLLVGIPVFVAQFVLILLLIIMPLALLLGASGDRGINLLKKYISALLGCLATKIIYGFYLGLILFFAVSMSSFPGIEDRPGLLALLVAVIFGFGIKYRKPFYEQIVALFSLAPEAAGEKASSWLGSTAKTLAYAYIFSSIKGNKSGSNDDPPGGGSGGSGNSGSPPGGGSVNPEPPPGGGGDNNNNDNDNNNNPPPDDGGETDPEPPAGDNSGGGNNNNGGDNEAGGGNPEPPLAGGSNDNVDNNDTSEYPARGYDFIDYDLDTGFGQDNNRMSNDQNDQFDFDNSQQSQHNVKYESPAQILQQNWNQKNDKIMNDSQNSNTPVDQSPNNTRTDNRNEQAGASHATRNEVQHNRSDEREAINRQIHNNTRDNAQYSNAQIRLDPQSGDNRSVRITEQDSEKLHDDPITNDPLLFDEE